MFQIGLGLDMKIVEVDDIALLQLGYKLEEILEINFYELLHPDATNLEGLVSAHKTLLKDAEASSSDCVFRLLCESAEPERICMKDQQKNNIPCIKATFQILSEQEAYAVMELQRHQLIKKNTVTDQSSQKISPTESSTRKQSKKRRNVASPPLQYQKQEIKFRGQTLPSPNTNVSIDLNNNEDLMENLETSFYLCSKSEEYHKDTGFTTDSLCSSLDTQELLLPPSELLYCPTLWPDFEKEIFSKILN
uniref:Uncharacterized protein n=1 Tax=Ditylenchus dipsaci TaxID=166011 RepID=A0A915DJ82_9BILA